MCQISRIRNSLIFKKEKNDFFLGKIVFLRNFVEAFTAKNKTKNQKQNIMKKLFTTTLALLLVASLTAQTSLESISFGARAGFNLTNVSGTIDNAKFKPGFQLVVVAQMPILDGLLTIQPGLLFAQQGYRINESTTTTTSESIFIATITTVTEIDQSFRMNINYLQIPINVQYKFEISNNARLVLQAGPYLGFALGGSQKGESNGRITVTTRVSFMGQTEETQTTSESTIDEDIRFGSETHEMRRFDIGAGFGAGVEFGNFQVGVGYNLGFTNLSNVGNTTMRNNGLAFTVTYLFGGGR